MNKLIYSLFIFSIFSFSSCNKKQEPDDCESLSMKSFKGSPQALNKFKKDCIKIEITYTKEKCQTALVDLIKTGSIVKVQNLHGDRVIGCFTENDLSTFSKDKPK